MKIAHRKWRTDRARGKSARRVTALRQLGAVLALDLQSAVKRKGFMRRFLEAQAKEDIGYGALVVLDEDGKAAPASTARELPLSLSPGRHGLETRDGIISVVPLEGAPGYIDIPDSKK